MATTPDPNALPTPGLHDPVNQTASAQGYGAAAPPLVASQQQNYGTMGAPGTNLPQSVAPTQGPGGPLVTQTAGAYSNTPPVQPPPYSPFMPPPVPTPGQVGPFGTKTPTPTAYGDFNAPDPNTFTKDPSYQFRVGEGEKALQRSAAARGSLLSGGFAKALTNYGQEAGSQEYQNAFNRALEGYQTNRDTNAQNFNQQLGSYNAALGGYTANANAIGQNNAANMGAYDRSYGSARDIYGDTQAHNAQVAAAQNANAQIASDNYAQQVEAARQQNQATRQNMLRPRAQSTGFQPRQIVRLG
jgi:hypothetical protein